MSRRHRGDDWQRALTVISHVSDEVQRYSRRQQRRRRQRRTRAGRVVRGVLWAVFASMVFVPLLLALGFGVDWLWGSMISIFALLATYGGLLHWVLREPEAPKLPQLTAGTPSEAIALLPAQTGDWLEQQRVRLPSSAQGSLDSIADRLEALTPQVGGLLGDDPSTQQVRRLLAEELPQLISGWNKVPVALRTQPLYGGSTPERQLLDGLDTIDKQIARLHEQLAKDDLHALATHQRYLDMKYNDDDNG